MLLESRVKQQWSELVEVKALCRFVGAELAQQSKQKASRGGINRGHSGANG